MKLLERNDACWCGSGKKYKKCHMRQEEQLIQLERKGYRIPSRELLKTPEEIEKIRRSGAVTRSILDRLADRIAPGITTNQINDWVHQWTLEAGGTPAPLGYKGYPKSTCTSIDHVICHGIPSDEPLKEGQILNVDITTILDGYYSDASRMFLIGEVDEKAKKLVDVTKEALEVGMRAVKPFESVDCIGEEIEAFANMRGYTVVQAFGGHGVGRAFHEDPFIHHHKTDFMGMIMVPGMVFTIEPMLNEGTFKCKILEDQWTAVTKDGKLSAQWEHTLLVTEDGYEILT